MNKNEKQHQERQPQVTLYEDGLTFSANRDVRTDSQSNITEDEVQGESPCPPVGVGTATATFKHCLALPGKAENMPSYSQVRTHGTEL